MSNKVNPLLCEKVSPLKYAVIAIGALALNFAIWSAVFAQVNNPGLFQSGAVVAGHCTSWGPGAGQLQDAGAACSPVTGLANPTATAGPAAVNGVATTAMRSDAAPAIQLGTNAQKGIVQVDGTTITAAAGVISGAAGANPTATATTAAVNGAAATFMRSDAAPAVAVTTFGGQTVGPGGTAGIQGNGAKIQLSTGATVSGNCVKYDVNGNTVDNGAVCGGASGANPTATASDTAVNGAAATFMRSDAAPAVQKGTNAAFGVVEGDGTTVTCAAGVCSGTSPAWSTFTPSLTCGTATFTTTSARRQTLGKTTFIELDFTITAIGTCTNAITFTLPNTAQSGASMVGREIVASGLGADASITAGSSNVNFTKSSAAVFLVNEHYVASGVYENQ